MRHINQFRSVLALAKYRHFGRASDSIGLTQSALSQSIQKLEALYGVPLFERARGQVSLTAYGEIVTQTARNVVDSIARAQREIKLLQNLETGHLMIGVDSYFASSLMSAALVELLSIHPNLRFTVCSADWTKSERQIIEEEIDIYFGFPPDATHIGINLERIETPTPLVLCSKSHELAGHDEISLAQAIKFPLATPTPPAWYVQWAQTQVDHLNNKVDVTNLMFLESDNIHMVKAVTKNSHALMAALPGDVIDEITSGEFKVLRVADWPATMYACIATKSNRTIPPAATLLIESFKISVGQQFELAQNTPTSADPGAGLFDV